MVTIYIAVSLFLIKISCLRRTSDADNLAFDNVRFLADKFGYALYKIIVSFEALLVVTKRTGIHFDNVAEVQVYRCLGVYC